jgi:type I restriction enzyme, S subunit
MNGWAAVSVGHLCQKRWLTIQDGNHGELHPKSSEFVENGIPFLMAKDVRPEGLNFSTSAKLPESRARALRIGFARSGDVLLTHKATVGQVGVVPDTLEWPFVMLTPQVTYYRSLTREMSGPYLALYFQSRIFQEQLEVLGLNQSTRPYIGLIEQRNLVICFPSAERQREIVGQYRKEGQFLDRAIERVRGEISLLREYRTRLIADVVTGKLDVRDAAARLPEEAEEPEPADEAEVPAENGEEGDDADAETVTEEAEA